MPTPLVSILAPVLDSPAPLLGEAAELAMRVHGDGLIGPFEGGLVRYVVGVEANMSMHALEA